MIDLYSRATPNGRKVAITLEETGLPYDIHPVNLAKKEQKAPEFLALNPNGRIPVIVDDDPGDGGRAVIFESGAILLYLAEKSGTLLPSDTAQRIEALKWLFFGSSQVTHTAMQVHYLVRRREAGEPQENLGVYVEELERLYGVLDGVLAGRAYLAGDEYSIADLSAWPWVERHGVHGIDIKRWPSLGAWLERIAERPATKRGYDVPPRGD